MPGEETDATTARLAWSLYKYFARLAGQVGKRVDLNRAAWARVAVPRMKMKRSASGCRPQPLRMVLLMTDANLTHWYLAIALLLGGCVSVCTCVAQEGPQPGSPVKAERVLFLGNSITLHGPHEPYGWRHNCGMAASVPEKDYVHVLAAALEARTGTHLRLSPTPSQGGAEPANIVNLAGTFERSYANYSNTPLQAQLAWKPDIVVLQCGENVVRDGFEPVRFREALRSLLGALQASGNPQIFITSQILGSGGALDDIKREACAEDPAHRTFVDLSGFHKDATNLASAEPFYTGIIVGHPGDKGMAAIAAALLEAMVGRGLGTAAGPAVAP